MRKYSQKHGWMILKTYAPGDGSIHFKWISDNDLQGPSIDEFVTESDVSEFLRQEAAEGNPRWKGWEIFVMWPDRTQFPVVRLIEPASRPFHTSKRLIFRGQEFEYATMRGDGQDYSPGNTTFWSVEDDGRYQVHNGDIILALCFFLNYEDDFAKQGFMTRETRAIGRRRAVHDVGVPSRG